MTKELILNTVCRICNVPPEMVLVSDNVKGARRGEFVHARHLCQVFAKAYNLGSLYAIGYFFGGRDHCAVLHAIKTVKNDCDTNKEKRIIYERIENELFTLNVDLEVEDIDYPSCEITLEALKFQTNETPLH